MLPLKDVIAALRRELSEALEENGPPPRGVRFEPERVVVSLEIALAREEDSVDLFCAVLETDPSSTLGLNGGPRQPHTVTIEFKPVVFRQEPGIAQQKTKEIPSAPIKAGPGGVQEITRSLESVFGEPGFDSSARATVFREALAGLSEAEAREVITSLQRTPGPDMNEMIRTRRHLIAGVLRSGPLQSQEKGGEILADLFRGNIPEILRLIAEVWKTQDDWLE